MLKIAVAGCCGKMGKMITSLVIKDPGIELFKAFEFPGHPEQGKKISDILGLDKDVNVNVVTDLVEALTGVGCLIDFTLPEPTIEHLEVCKKLDVPIVIGTTGFSSKQENIIADASEEIAIVFSPNMAPGVNLLFSMIAKASKVLGQDFNISMDETHHVHKKDSPSGTAKMMQRVVQENCGKYIEVDAKREGEVIGNHGIVFDGMFETLEIRHNAKSREAFAAGAIKAAKFIKGKSAGLYTMFDVLDIA
ncbi:MAG: 4-hydroxy-tetrahydrodipicolinate reductase [Candidatus Omnitrophica bacterium]|nr:4-hydroxy-tetrahydrodipicolinate reductase [Candidatus Omnitrophota bacterium]